MGRTESRLLECAVPARTRPTHPRQNSALGPDLEAVVEAAPVGIVVFDAPRGRPAFFNREARRIVWVLGTADRPLEELLEVMTFRFSDGSEIALDELLAAPALCNATTMRAEEVVLSVPDGRSVTTLVSAAPVHSHGGTVDTVVVTMQNLAPLQELERLRAEFLDMVSHELRAPLTSIKGSAATLLEESADLDAAEMREFHRIIHEQADHMRGLVGDLLDAGRIEAGTLSVAPEPSEVAALVDRARTTFLSGGGRHAVLIDLSPDLPRVMADRRRIVQVLNNLLSNAARHSPEIRPIRVQAAREGMSVAISVRDEGRGVAPKLLPHLFRKHAGATTDSARVTTGVGLGLLICKGLVEAHGGRIRAESGGVGQGSRFTFTIPVAEDATRSESPGPGKRLPGSRRRAREPARILVVDDHPETLRHVRDTLDRAGYTVLVTGDHAKLSHLIRTGEPHLVLLDFTLPGTNGITLMGSVPELADLPVIFLSGYNRDETIAEALNAGATDYIVKPFSPTVLVAKVRVALRNVARSDPLMLGTLTIHHEERKVTVAGAKVDLTATEYRLLHELSLNAGLVLTYDTLLRRVWRGSAAGDSDLVRNYVKRLRAKLGEDAQRPTRIFNVRGIGYRMANPREE